MKLLKNITITIIVVAVLVASWVLLPTGALAKLKGSPELDLKEIALGIHKHINIERENKGLSALGWNPALADIAGLHSRDMGVNGFLKHDSPSTGSFGDRYESAGFKCRVRVGDIYYAGAENIFTTFTYGKTYYSGGKIVKREWMNADRIARQAVKSWMNSKGHRENLLKPFWLEEGIGVFIGKKGKVLVTQNFC